VPKSSGSRAANRNRGAVAGCTATSPGAPKGNRNALKHGIYTAEAIANRRKVGALLRAARKLFTAQRGGHFRDTRG
jgi:flavin-dependent dehydrogenase